MPSKSFDEILNKLPAEDKDRLNQAKSMVSNIQETNSTEITQHSTPSDTYKDAHRTAAPATTSQPPETPSPTTPPTTTQGNSATFNEVTTKQTTATSTGQIQSGKLTQ